MPWVGNRVQAPCSTDSLGLPQCCPKCICTLPIHHREGEGLGRDFISSRGHPLLCAPHIAILSWLGPATQRLVVYGNTLLLLFLELSHHPFATYCIKKAKVTHSVVICRICYQLACSLALTGMCFKRPVIGSGQR